MTTTSPVTTTDTYYASDRTNQQKVTLADDFSDFLKLLTTQLQNQDPLSPMDSTEFTNQLVQFSQVEQSINTNQKLDALVQLQLASAAQTAFGYMGMDISYISAEMHYDGSTPIRVNYSLSNEALMAKANIYDDKGVLVKSIEIPSSAGRHEFTWDGTNMADLGLEEGTYSIKIDALDKDEKPIASSTAVSGRVKGIETQNGVLYVLVGDRAVPLANILQARTPVATPLVPPANDEGADT